MRLGKSQLVLLIALVTALVVTSATSGSTGHATKQQPTVTVSEFAPVTVTGRGFLPKERVTVRVATGGDVASKVVRATRTGRFVAQFPGIDVATPDCTSVLLIAVATGTRSTATTRGRTIPAACGFFPQP